MGVGLGVAEIAPAGHELAHARPQLAAEVELAGLVAGEVAAIDGLPQVGGLLRAELPARQTRGPQVGGAV